MGDRSKIEWTDASWTPIRARVWETQNDGSGRERLGWHCSHVSEGCRNCYSEAINLRLGTGRAFKPSELRDLDAHRRGCHTGEVELFLDERMLTQPLSWKRPRVIFVCSMTDLFADFVPDEWIDRVFAITALAPQHRFVCLTKRAARMRKWTADRFTGGCRGAIERRARQIARERGIDIPAGKTLASPEPFPHVVLGVSVEDQARADERIPELLATIAAERVVSIEPMLGRISFRWAKWVDEAAALRSGSLHHLEGLRGIDGVIVGGESQRGARPMHPDWSRSLRDECAEAEVPFFFKQWGSWAPVSQMSETEIEACYEPAPPEHPGATRSCKVENEVLHRDGCRLSHEARNAFLAGKGEMSMFRVGKKRAGRLLDGREHNDLPWSLRDA